MSITPDFNKYPKIANFDEVIFIAQQAYELGFRGGTGEELYAWLKSRLDLTGLSNTAGLPEDFPAPGSTLSATNKGEWTILTPGTYNKIVSGTIVVEEGEFAFAQFDGTDFNLVGRVEMPEIDLSGKVDKGGYQGTAQELSENALITLKNLIVNGDFSDEDSGWLFRSNITNHSVNDGVLHFTGGGKTNSTVNNWIHRVNTNNFVDGNVIYVTAIAKSDSQAVFYLGAGYDSDTFNLTDNWVRCSTIKSRHEYNYPVFGAELGGIVQVKNIMSFDLTEMFGAGNEPSFSDFDSLLSESNLDYFRDISQIPIVKYTKWITDISARKIDLESTTLKVNNLLDLKITSILNNGGFEQNKSGWTSAGVAGTGGGSSIVSDIVLRGEKALKIINNDGVRREVQSVYLKNGDKYYLRGSVFIESYESGEIVVLGKNLGSEFRNELGVWHTVSRELVGDGDSLEVRVGSNNNYGTWTAVFDELVVYNLTDIFGAGKEPSAQQMDNVVDSLFSEKSLVDESEVSLKGIFNYINVNTKPLNNILSAVTPIVTLSSDDGFATDYDLYKMLQRYGMRGTTFAVSTYLNKPRYLTDAQVKEMADGGWEFGCHTYQHLNLTSLDFPEDVINQIYQNKAHLENLTGKKVTTFAHPFGGTNAEIRNLLNSFYEGGRVSPTGYNEFGDIPNIFNLKTYWDHHTTTTVQRVKDLIDTLISNPARHLMISMHELSAVQGADTFTLADWEEVAIYLKNYQMQGKLEVLTFADAVRKMRALPFLMEL